MSIRRRGSACLAAVLGLLAAAGVARAAWYTVGPTAFHAQSSAIAGVTSWTASDAELSVTGAEVPPVFTAPVNLPEGAVIKRIMVWYTRAYAADALTVYLYRHQMSTGTVQTVAYRIIPTPTSTYRLKAEAAAVAANATVANGPYTYSLRLVYGLGSRIKVHGVKIEY